MATELYHRIVGYDYGDPELMLKVWSPTPWAIDVIDFEPNSKEWFEFIEWAEENIGPQSWPIHGKPGDWYRGSATVHGRTHYGFSSEEAMDKFIARYPDRITTPTEQDERKR